MCMFHVLVSALVVLLNFTVVRPEVEVNGLTTQQQQAWKDVNCNGITEEKLDQMLRELPQANMDWKSGHEQGFYFKILGYLPCEQICREVRGTMLTQMLKGVQYDQDRAYSSGIWMEAEHGGLLSLLNRLLNKFDIDVESVNAKPGDIRKARLIFVNVYLSAAKALKNFHVQFPNMLHLDVKLQNFLSTKDGEDIWKSPAEEFDAKIISFEFSQTLEELKTRNRIKEHDPVLVDSNGMKRSTVFMSTEMRRGHDITHSSDIFSLGAQLRRICVHNLKGKARDHFEFDKLKAFCSEGLRDIIHKCLGTLCLFHGKWVETARYENAGALVDDLRALLLKEAKPHALVEDVRALLQDEAKNQEIVNELYALLNEARNPERVNEEAPALVEDVRALDGVE